MYPSFFFFIHYDQRHHTPVCVVVEVTDHTSNDRRRMAIDCTRALLIVVLTPLISLCVIALFLYYFLCGHRSLMMVLNSPVLL